MESHECKFKKDRCICILFVTTLQNYSKIVLILLWQQKINYESYFINNIESLQKILNLVKTSVKGTRCLGSVDLVCGKRLQTVCYKML